MRCRGKRRAGTARKEPEAPGPGAHSGWPGTCRGTWAAASLRASGIPSSVRHIDPTRPATGSLRENVESWCASTLDEQPDGVGMFEVFERRGVYCGQAERRQSVDVLTADAEVARARWPAPAPGGRTGERLRPTRRTVRRTAPPRPGRQPHHRRRGQCASLRYRTSAVRPRYPLAQMYVTGDANSSLS